MIVLRLRDGAFEAGLIPDAVAPAVPISQTNPLFPHESPEAREVGDTQLPGGVLDAVGFPSVPLHRSMTSRSASISGWVGVALMVAVLLGTPMLLLRGSQAKRPFDERVGRRLAKERPEVVLIGDSMLETRIEPRRLNEVARRRCSVLEQSGSSSAMWFLMMKNLVAELEPPPRWVIVFFRDRQLTVPGHRTEGGYRPTMETYMRDTEPLVDALVPRGRTGADRWLERASLAFWPMQHRRDVWGGKVQNWALDAVASSRDYQGVRDATRELFDLKKLRADGGYNESAGEGEQKLDADAHDFATAVGRCVSAGHAGHRAGARHPAAFFRVKRKPLADGSLAKESPTLPAYVGELSAYLEGAGAFLVDESRDAGVTRDFYAADDHVTPRMQRRYTEHFWPRVRPVIEAAEAGAGR